jgi:molybdate transport system substrate-binding protein
MCEEEVAVRKLLAIAVGLLVATGATADGAEIKVISAKAAGLFLGELAPQFERVTGNKVTISYDEAGIVRKRILGGEAFDVTFLPAGWDEVRKALAGDPVAIAHSDLGMAVLSTAPKPDTSTSKATRRTLVAVKSIVYTDPKTGGIAGVLFARMIERLGIADEVNKKSKLVVGQLNATFVAKGEAELAVQLSSEIREVPGVQFVPMPPEFRASVTFSGAAATDAKEPATAKAFLEFLTDPSAAPAIRSKGFEPG